MSRERLSTYLLIEPMERSKVFWACFYFFVLLAAYFVLRPIRDEMGILNGASNMQWLFTGTFLSMLAIVPVFGMLCRKYAIARVLRFSYVFFILNIIAFYILFSFKLYPDILPIVFFIWLSVFNLFAVSLFWSFMVDLFTTEQSKRLFGIIAVGGSLGAILGPLLTQSLIGIIGIENLFLLALLLLFLVLWSLVRLQRMHRLSRVEALSEDAKTSLPLLGSGSILSGIKMVWDSAYLQKLVLFMLLYTSVSTFLYFEQAHIVEATLADSTARVTYFSRVDLITNTLAISGQLLLTNRMIRKFGLAITLCAVPVLIGLGFLLLSKTPILLVIGALMVLHRTGNFILLRPGREMLYTVCNRGEKYLAKNFLDTAIYRGGDALSGWAFAGLVSLGFGLSWIALIAVPLVMLWSYTGFRLGRKAEESSKNYIHQKTN
ncbi:NTP/NDP exchange transporter [Poritiphilus flavus]|uniref:MFS transporter n=1 Tax=Poritiphilus flavus TaxID=2697053 RepID=A0A6L9EDU3_9FLAO|nr:MFS transporter [Poritiphilus flavus]NAS12866.1 MFS transporter [Poritiphilus flavus]